jgi:hypothetical protein
MDNSVNDLMDGWGSEADPDKLFSDQIEDDQAFFYEEPEIGIEDLTLDSPQSGITRIPSDINTKAAKIEEIPSEGKPDVFKMEVDELERLAKEKRGIEIGNELDTMLGYIAEYGVIHGLGLFYAENDKYIEDNYGEEESLGQSPGDIQASE